MTSPQDQQRQFQERIARLNANRASASQLQAAADPLKGALKARSRASMPNSNLRFGLVMVVLLVLGGGAGWVAADFDKVSQAKRERVPPEVVFLQQG
jgi:hypothetical protein